jgi:predicted RNA binding protein YcfA (HicA-like mRNA interferase family)
VKLPRDLSGPEVVRALVRLGFAQDRQDGSHIRLLKGGLRVTVPNHRSIALKTLQSILRQAQITIEELKDVL